MEKLLSLIYSILKDFIGWICWKDQQKIVDLNWIEIPEVKKRICPNGYECVWTRNDKVETKKLDGWKIAYDFDSVKRIRFKITTRDSLILIKRKNDS